MNHLWWCLGFSWAATLCSSHAILTLYLLYLSQEKREIWRRIWYWEVVGITKDECVNLEYLFSWAECLALEYFRSGYLLSSRDKKYQDDHSDNLIRPLNTNQKDISSLISAFSSQSIAAWTPLEIICGRSDDDDDDDKYDHNN